MPHYGDNKFPKWKHGYNHGADYENRSRWIRETSNSDAVKLVKQEHKDLKTALPYADFMKTITWGDREAFHSHKEKDEDLQALAIWYNLRIIRNDKEFGPDRVGSKVLLLCGKRHGF